jgi:hypothetical protein
MNFEKSIILLRAEFLDRLEDDFFDDIVPAGTPASIAAFIECMTVGNVLMREIRNIGVDFQTQFPDLTDLNIRFRDLLEKRIKSDRDEVRVGTIFHADFCASVVKGLAVYIARRHPKRPGDESVLVDVSLPTWERWASEITLPENSRVIARALFDTALSELGDRQLLSFFIRPAKPGQFSAWGPETSSGAGRPLKPQIVHGDGYSVSVDVSKYEEVECEVTAYEWLAKLTLSGATEPDAVACGMVYVFNRTNGELVGGMADLMLAADSMADSDVMQVNAFRNQHADAQNVIEDSDLCFVWLWDRREGASKGLGAACLEAGLRSIRSRFKRVKTVVIDARPSQFVSWVSLKEPPMVTVEKQTAVESLVNHIRSLKLDVDVRPVFNCSSNSHEETMEAIGQVIDAASEQDGDDEEIDLEVWGESITSLFVEAGLTELANDLDEGVASQEDVETALKQLVFDAQVQYVRVSSSGRFDESWMRIAEIPHDQAHDTIDGFDEFCASLPATMNIDAVALVDDFAVCKVVAQTPFGSVYDYFTLVRKPRPLNIEQYFNGI